MAPARPALEAAVEEKIEEQAKFVAWWRETVTPNHGAGRGNKTSAVRGTFSMSDAEVQTGIRNQQVSLWAKRLQDRDKYRDSLASLGVTDLSGFVNLLASEADVLGLGGTKVVLIWNDFGPSSLLTYFT